MKLRTKSSVNNQKCKQQTCWKKEDIYNDLVNWQITNTGKSLSEALIFASTNPQYDVRLFIELQVQYMNIPSSEHGENILCTEFVFDVQNNVCTQHVLPMFWKKKSLWKRFTCKKANELALSLDALNTSLKLHAVTDPAESIYLQQIFRPAFFVSNKEPLGTKDVNFSFFTSFANKDKNCK